MGTLAVSLLGGAAIATLRRRRRGDEDGPGNGAEQAVLAASDPQRRARTPPSSETFLPTGVESDTPDASWNAGAATGRIRACGVLLVASVLWYVPWFIGQLDLDRPWLAIPFALANLILIAGLLVSLTNNWFRSTPEPLRVAVGHEPAIGIIVPTAGEPVGQVAATVRSVLNQDWPQTRMTVVISDDARSPLVKKLAEDLRDEYSNACILYYSPPRRGSPNRIGEAKAGNLNAALGVLAHAAPEALFIETRDADDLVGDPSFLRRTVAQLLMDEDVAYVQTVKEAHVEPGDPFDNRQPHFYRGSMFARHAANAVFPCGSGLVWRRAALDDIGGFPAWNLVEDLQSGVEALARGWRGSYVPIVGALAQHAPEDIPNVYKQRGTWALDTMRLLVWRRLSGLSLRQRLHFVELGLFYTQSVALTIFILMPVFGFLFAQYPLRTDFVAYTLHFWPFAIALELFLASLFVHLSYESLWRARQIWIGLTPVYGRAWLQAIANGPNRKPTYRVTRKTSEYQWYWRETMPQAIAFIVLASSLVYSLLATPSLATFDAGSAYWAVFFLVLLGGFMRRSWFGLAGLPGRGDEPTDRAPSPSRTHAWIGGQSIRSVTGALFSCLHRMGVPENWLRIAVLASFGRFILVGAAASAVYLGGTQILIAVGAHYLVAAAASGLLSVSISFVLNREWTFQHDSYRLSRQVALHCLAVLTLVGLNLAVLHALVVSGLHFVLVAQLVAGALLLPFNFLINRNVVFRAQTR